MARRLTRVPAVPLRSTEPPDPVGASMASLTSIMQNPQDAAYEAQARRREARGQTASAGTRTALTFLIALAMGLLAATAWLAHRAPATTEGMNARRLLVARIERAQSDADARAASVAAQRQELDSAQAAVLRERSRGEIATDLDALNRLSGAVAVTGPGLEITLDDAPSTALGDEDSEGRVIARDLQMVANGLWAAGAEAVSINGHRLAGNASIRFAGEAILVDYRALGRPYVVTAIGDPQALRQGYLEGADGRQLAEVRDELGIRLDLVEKTSLTVPADTQMVVRYATVKEN